MREVWKDIPKYEGFYKVSNLGRVKSLPRLLKNRYSIFLSKEKLLTPKKNGNGYLWVKLCVGGEKSFAVHRLVMLAFVGKSDLVVNHLDLNKLNNRLDNLEYCTRRENVHHYEKSVKRASAYIGVCFDKSRGKWTAKMKIKGKTVNLGRYTTELEAYHTIKKHNDTSKRLSN